MLNLLFALIGLLVGGLLNALADDLPARVRPQRPHCPSCYHFYGPAGWWAFTRLFQGGHCPNCRLPTRRRALLTEAGTAVLFALLPSFIEPPIDLIVYAVYTAVLILVIVIDIEHRLILHVVTIPTTLLAIPASFILSDTTMRLSVVGAVVGFLFFFALFWIGERVFGAGALGFGDVTLSMTMGAMLGFQRIFFALIFGIVLGGLWSIIALLSRRMKLRSYFAYGPFLALAGLAMILWGNRLVALYVP